ncbi:ABC transporter permease [Stomatohabitans albus]|uniref:ABC transporter permease n=1 Tax=Stomatohabitans albus TaxID=3110766 RepID=UPI00300C52F6
MDSAVKRFIRDQRFIVGALVLLLLIGWAITWPMINPFDPLTVSYDQISLPPSGEHLMGTDQLGRDVMAMTARGLQVSLLLATTVAISSTILGMGIGIAMGLFGGFVDRIGMRLIDAFNALPHLLLSLVIVAMFRSVTALTVAIAVTHWTNTARLVRAMISSISSRPYVTAAVQSGATMTYIALRHMIPTVMPQAIVAIVLMMPHAVWHESALSFLGLGMPLEVPSIGTLLSDARQTVILGTWWQVLGPAIVLVATVLSVSAIGQSARDHLAKVPGAEETLL